MANGQPINGPDRLRDYLRTYKRDGATWSALGSTLRGYIRDGIPKRPIDRTFARMDKILQWEAGSAQSVFEGGEPVPLPTHADASVSAAEIHRVEDELLNARKSIGIALDALHEASLRIRVSTYCEDREKVDSREQSQRH